MSNEQLIPCKFCDEGFLQRKSLPRHGKPTYIAANILIYPAIIVLGLKSQALYESVRSTLGLARLDEVFSGVAGLTPFLLSAALLLMSIYLSSRQKIMQCENCEAVVPRE